MRARKPVFRLLKINLIASFLEEFFRAGEGD